VSAPLSIRPPLDPDFQPAAAYERDYAERVASAGQSEDVRLVVERNGIQAGERRMRILTARDDKEALTGKLLERAIKSLLWKVGGDSVRLEGPRSLQLHIERTFSASGPRNFDMAFFKRVYGAAAPEQKGPLGGHTGGCRVGFDLGASDRKVAAVKDGELVYSAEHPWDPRSLTRPEDHLSAVLESIEEAKAKLPRLDALGGSTAGILVGSELRQSSLFRGVDPSVFEGFGRIFFKQVAERAGAPRSAVANDGAVSALAGSMSLGVFGVLGCALGSSFAAGFVGVEGRIGSDIDELAFAPIDYNDTAPEDEWSKDRGCAVQYLSQQAVARLLPRAGIDLPEDMPLPERLIQLQTHMAEGHEGARRLYRTLGVFLASALAQYSSLYAIRHVLLQGRVMTGDGGTVLVEAAKEALSKDYPELAGRFKIHLPDETQRRHGQAAAAASLPPALGARES